MNLALVTAILLGAAALLGIARTWRARAPHRAARIALQLVAAALLYAVLYPPRVDERFVAGSLIVLTPGATAEQMTQRAAGSTIVALPGATSRRDIEQVPDLGTALRRHPDTARLHVVGGGLPPRDIDAARGLPLAFDAAPLPNGIVDLAAPTEVRAGGRFDVSGRVEGEAGGRVELRDPSGAVIAQDALANDGTFSFAAQAKSAGTAEFALRVLDRDGASIENLTLPVNVRPGTGARVLVLAGAADPELKYLRRWAVDTGVDLTSRIALSDGIAMRDGAEALTPGALAKTDLVIVDERAWKALDGRAKSALIDGVRSGLGLFLRITGPLPADVADDWRRLGFDVRAADIAQSVSLHARSGAAEPVVLTRLASAVDADRAAPLLRADDGSALALWRAEGQGRIAAWWLADSYRLALAGDAGAFGTLWSDAIATVARTGGAAAPNLPAAARADRRSVICDIADGAYVERPDATQATLTIDAASASRRCAAYWPAEAGWHTLVSGGARWPFPVRAAGEASALAAAHDADATRALAGAHASDSTIATRQVPAPRWPFFAAWLVAVAGSWWLERRRAEAIETVLAVPAEPARRWDAAQDARAA